MLYFHFRLLFKISSERAKVSNQLYLASLVTDECASFRHNRGKSTKASSSFVAMGHIFPTRIL